MLRHLHSPPRAPARVAVLGSGGFVGGAVAAELEGYGIPVLRLGRGTLDLLAPDASERLASELRSDDALVVVSASAPCRTPAQLVVNFRMVEAVAAALARQSVAHLVYVSSDAVYADSDKALTESSCASPSSIHGAMHLAREVVLRDAAQDTPCATLRPTLLYGAGDPHNGYGPNQFRRLAARGQAIVLFGEGEERRDHVWIGDVAEIAHRVLTHRSDGVLNIASGKVATFKEIADAVAEQFVPRVPIKYNPRKGPVPHNGYRAFDAAASKAAFPDFAYTSLAEGLARSLET